MKLENVFVGFTHDGKERLVYKKIIDYDIGRSMTIYLDLKTNEVFDCLNVDTTSLKQIKEVLNIKKDDIFKIKLVNLYDKDRSDIIYDTVYNENIVKKKYLEMKYKEGR